MRKIAFLLLAAFVMTTFAFAVGADAPAPKDAEASAKEVTMNGEYVWATRDVTGDLKAVFTQTGEDAWEVSFYFHFREKPHTYTGTATGSLTEGTLNGEAFNEDKRRKWEFQADVKEGVINGKHQELTEGRESNTGTFMLK